MIFGIAIPMRLLHRVLPTHKGMLSLLKVALSSRGIGIFQVALILVRNMLAALLREGDRGVEYLMCLVPRHEYEIVDDWQVLGMSGTGSKSVKAKDVFVPAHRALSMLKARGGRDFPGASIHQNPLFTIGLSTMGTHCLVGAAIGNAQAALETTIDLVEQRSTSYQSLKMRDLPAVQQRIQRELQQQFDPPRLSTVCMRLPVQTVSTTTIPYNGFFAMHTP